MVFVFHAITHVLLLSSASSFLVHPLLWRVVSSLARNLTMPTLYNWLGMPGDVHSMAGRTPCRKGDFVGGDSLL